MTTDHPPIDRQKSLEEAQRLLQAALDTIFPGRFTLSPTSDLTDEGEPAIEVGNGAAALEPVIVTVPCGVGGHTYQTLYWRVYQAVRASDPSVGRVGCDLVPAPLEGRAVAWHLPGRLTAALSSDLGISDDLLHHQLARHNLVVARVWGQGGCYAHLTNAIRHIISDLVDRTLNNVFEDTTISIAQERGEE